MWIRTLIAIFLLASPVLAETFTFGNDTDVEDVMIRSNVPGANYGSRTDISVFDNGSFYYSSLIRVQNLSDSIGAEATITAAICSLYNLSGSGCTVYAYRVFKPWVEGVLNGGTPSGNGKGATWNDWSANNKEWAIAGCDSTDDSGSDNSGDGDEADRQATEIDSVDVDAAGAWFVFTIPTSLAQGWYDGTINEEGILLKVIAACGGIGFRSIDDETNPPRWVFTYTTAEAAAAPQVIIIGGGQ